MKNKVHCWGFWRRHIIVKARPLSSAIFKVMFMSDAQKALKTLQTCLWTLGTTAQPHIFDFLHIFRDICLSANWAPTLRSGSSEIYEKPLLFVRVKIVFENCLPHPICNQSSNLKREWMREGNNILSGAGMRRGGSEGHPPGYEWGVTRERRGETPGHKGGKTRSKSRSKLDRLTSVVASAGEDDR